MAHTLSSLDGFSMRAKRTDRPSEMTAAANFHNAGQWVLDEAREHPDWPDADILSAARLKMSAHFREMAAKSAAARREAAGLDASGLLDAGSDGADADS